MIPLLAVLALLAAPSPSPPATPASTVRVHAESQAPPLTPVEYHQRTYAQGRPQLARAIGLYFALDFGSAQATLDSVTWKAAPDDPDVLIIQAAIALARGQYERAIRSARRVIDADDCHALAHLILARAYVGRDEYRNGPGLWRHCLKAVACDSSLVGAWMRIWWLALAREQPDWEKRACRAMAGPGGLAPALLAGARWVLRHLPPDAVYLTAGGATFATVALQEAEGLGRDLAVIDVNLLALDWYRDLVCKRYGLPRPERQRLQMGPETPSQVVVHTWCEAVDAGRLARPLTASLPAGSLPRHFWEGAWSKGTHFLYVGEAPATLPAVPLDTAAVRASLIDLDPKEMAGPLVSCRDESPYRANWQYLASTPCIVAVQYALTALADGWPAEAGWALDWADRYLDAVELPTRDAFRQDVEEVRGELAHRRQESPQWLAQALERVPLPRRQAWADTLYRFVRDEEWIPLVADSSVVFVYLAPDSGVGSVEVRGDLNAWGNEPGAAAIPLHAVAGTRLYLSDPVPLPPAARIDYKLVLDGRRWLLDPGNPRQCWGGFGPNSEFRLPGYEPSPWVVPQEGIAHGTLSPPGRLASASLGYDVAYQVYLPAGFDPGHRYPALFVTDGQEYADPKLGALLVAADNLLAAGRITPPIIVLVDPRDPDAPSRNRREQQYACNPAFAAFLADELYPRVAADYPLAGTPETTGILGTSLGGLNSAYLGLTRPAVFGLVALQSPALRYRRHDRPALLELYRQSPRVPLSRIWIDAGTIFDTAEGARELRDLLAQQGYPEVSYHEYPEGHSWGSWRARVGDILVYLFGR